MSDLKSRLIKASTTKLTADLTKSKLFNGRDEVPTRIPMLNIALGGGLNTGLQSGLTIFAAPSKHFKTLFGLTMVAAYMKKYPDAICLFYDSEFGASESYFRSMGVDLERVVHTPIQSVEKLKIDMTNQLEEIQRGEKVIIFIDSIGNTASKKETQDALDEKEVGDMSRAKSLKSLFRIVTPYLTIKDIPCVAINHTAMEIGGIDPFSGLLEMATELGFVVKPKAGWYSRAYLDEDTGEMLQEEKSWRAKATDDVEFWGPLFKHKPFRDAIETKYKLGAISSIKEVDDAVADLLNSKTTSKIPDLSKTGNSAAAVESELDMMEDFDE